MRGVEERVQALSARHMADTERVRTESIQSVEELRQLMDTTQLSQQEVREAMERLHTGQRRQQESVASLQHQVQSTQHDATHRIVAQDLESRTTRFEMQRAVEAEFQKQNQQTMQQMRQMEAELNTLKNDQQVKDARIVKLERDIENEQTRSRGLHDYMVQMEAAMMPADDSDMPIDDQAYQVRVSDIEGVKLLPSVSAGDSLPLKDVTFRRTEVPFPEHVNRELEISAPQLPDYHAPLQQPNFQALTAQSDIKLEFPVLPAPVSSTRMPLFGDQLPVMSSSERALPSPGQVPTRDPTLPMQRQIAGLQGQIAGLQGQFAGLQRQVPVQQGHSFAGSSQAPTIFPSAQLRPREPPVFRGEVNEDLGSWMSAVRDYCYLLGTSDLQSVAYASTLFQGNARVWWNSYLRSTAGMRPADLMTLENAIQERFQSPMFERQARFSLWSISQRAGESVHTFAARFMNLLQRLPVFDEQDMRERFIRALLPSLRLPVAQRETKTLTETIRVAEYLELLGGVYGGARSHGGATGQAMLGDITGQPSSHQRGRGRGRRGGRGQFQFKGRSGRGQGRQFGHNTDYKCYICGDPNHLANSCPRRPSAQQHRGRGRGMMQGSRGRGFQGGSRGRSGGRRNFARLNALAGEEAQQPDQQPDVSPQDIPMQGNA